MNKILDLKKIKEAKVNKEAFPFFSVSNVFLNNKSTKELKKDFPEILKGGSFPSDSLKAGPSFKKLVDGVLAISSSLGEGNLIYNKKELEVAKKLRAHLNIK